MTAFGNYTLWDNQDVSKFYLLFQKMGGGGQMPLLLPPGYATASPPHRKIETAFLAPSPWPVVLIGVNSSVKQGGD